MMNLKGNIQTALLLAIGFIMHYIVPGVFAGMKFDFMLAFVFIAIFLNPSFKNAMLTAGVAGFLAALTTSFPGGQIPNIIDKFATCIVVYLLVTIVNKLDKANIISYSIISMIGTMVSGVVFLLTALLLVGLPAPLNALIIGVVLPTTVGNIVFTSMVYTAVTRAKKLARA